MFTRVVFQVKHCSEHSAITAGQRNTFAAWACGAQRRAPRCAAPRRASQARRVAAAAEGVLDPSGRHHSSAQPRSRQANQMTSQPTSDTRADRRRGARLPRGRLRTVHFTLSSDVDM